MKGRKRPTLTDVARHAKVSTATASRVLHNTSPVSHDLRKRIEASVAALGYVPRSTPKRPEQNTLALLMGDLLNPFFLEIARGVQDEANDTGLILTLYNLTDHPQRQSQLLRKLSKPPVTGVILTGSSPCPELLAWQARHKIPLVLLNRRANQPGVHCIMVDFENAMYRATQHLLNLNHTRIGHLASPSTGEIAQARQRGIIAALAEVGLTLRPEWCPIVPPGTEVEGGFQAMRALLDLPAGERPTAIIAFNDIIALGALHAMRAHGLCVPQDISIVGVDDIAVAAHTYPPLTTIGQPKYRMGKLAVQTLRRMSEGRLSPGNNCTLLESPLIVRESTGPAPQTSEKISATGDSVTQPSPSEPMWHEALDFSFERVRQNLASLDSFPENTEGDHWNCVDDGGWVGGHWVGLLWLAYAHTGDLSFNAAARQWAARLAPRQDDTTTHDLGFLFELSHSLGARLTGDASLKPSVLQAARTLTLRFNPKGKFIQAWGPLKGTAAQRGRAIIDTMMNLDLLFGASRETGERKFADMAIAHARTALARHVRADGSTSHVTDFDPDTGKFIKQDTHQGLSATSCWSRGQAWAAYGFAECYRETKDAAFLDAARHLAEYCLRRQPSDHVPYWDYDSPLIPNDVRDSSAASILASGMLLLATLEPDRARTERWRSEAITILESLWRNYSTRGAPEPSILKHATRSKPHGLMDHGLIYGDYYFVEALTRLVKPNLPL